MHLWPRSSALSALSRTPTIWRGVSQRAPTPTRSSPTTTTRTRTSTTPGTTACSRTSPARAHQRWRRRSDSSRLCPHQAQTLPAFFRPPRRAPPPRRRTQWKATAKVEHQTRAADGARSVCRHNNGHHVSVLFFSCPASRTEDRQDRHFQDREDDCMSPLFSLFSKYGNIFILENLFSPPVSIPLL